MTCKFVDVLNVLMLICCHIALGTPYLNICVEDVVALLGAMTDHFGVKACLW